MGNRSALGLDGVNLFVASMQTAFGAFVTVYLVKGGWPPQAIGFALSIGTLSSLISQLPAGGYIDTLPDKRKAVMLGIVGVATAALLLCLTASRSAVYIALSMQGLASALIGPGIAAISLALVGQVGLSVRIGRNARFASIGNGIAAGVMGLAGSYLPAASVFLVAAALCVPALFALSMIGGEGTAETVPAAWSQEESRVTWAAMKRQLVDRRLAIFAVCVLLYFAASGALGPGFAGQVTRRQPEIATMVVALTILLPQTVVAAISPWIGRRADLAGRKPLLLVGWGLVPLQPLLYAAWPGNLTLAASFLLNAVSGAIFGVLMTVVAADLTRRSGWFNLTLGALGVTMSIGAALSTFFAGLAAGAFGPRVAAVGLALVGICGVLLVWAGMPETRERLPAGPAGGIASN